MATYTFVTTDTEEAGIADAAGKAADGASNAEYVERVFRSAVTSWVSAASVTVTLSAAHAASLATLLGDPKVVIDADARDDVLRQVAPVQDQASPVQDPAPTQAIGSAAV